ncbi:MAG: formylglycine-generating enzyme family protein [Fimbriimonadaceae bacterium]
MKLFVLAPLILLSACTPAPAGGPKADSPPRPIVLKFPPRESPIGFTWIPGGTFKMGKADGLPDAKPVHEVTLNGFWISTTEITNAQFTEFIRETKHKTTAEQNPNPAEFPGADPKDLVPGALIHTESGWKYIKGANWMHPAGPKSNLNGLGNHPVVNVSYDDALAYCNWAGATLPSEAQFEYAERGGMSEQKYDWGNVQQPNKKHMANIWQGEFPVKNLNTDGFLTTAPVKSFPPNRYGLYDMSGNVWEWCLDWYDPNFYSKRQRVVNPINDIKPTGPDPSRVTRGGSFLCSDNYCLGYQPGTRMKTTPDAGLYHTGFRCVINP